MPLISEGRFVADIWQRPAAGEVLEVSGRYLLPLGRFLAEGESLAAGNHVLGVEIPNDADLHALEPWLARLQLIAVDFPKSADGRGFSIAARLRRMGYKGELRACGHVIADQYAAAKASGFDAVEIPAALAVRQPESHWAAASQSMSIAYQQGHSVRRNILAARWKN